MAVLVGKKAPGFSASAVCHKGEKFIQDSQEGVAVYLSQF